MEVGDGGAQIVGAEVGPQSVDEAELGVGALPQQEVGQPLLAAGADEEIDRRVPAPCRASRRPKASRDGACAAGQRAAAPAMASREE